VKIPDEINEIGKTKRYRCTNEGIDKGLTCFGVLGENFFTRLRGRGVGGGLGERMGLFLFILNGLNENFEDDVSRFG
jgi:hypothetical protein